MKILEAKEHQEFTEKTATIRERMEVSQKQLDVLKEEMREVEGGMPRQEMDPFGTVN